MANVGIAPQQQAQHPASNSQTTYERKVEPQQQQDSVRWWEKESTPNVSVSLACVLVYLSEV